MMSLPRVSQSGLQKARACASALLVSLVCLPWCRSQLPLASSNLNHIRNAGQFIVQGDLARAEAELNFVLTTDPNDYRALNLLGVIRAQQGRNPEAEQLFKRVIEQKPDYASAHVDLGLLYRQMGDGDRAITELERALQLDPARQDARSALVQTLQSEAREALQRQQYEKSLSLLIKARKLLPLDPDVNYEFGLVALRMSLYLDAAQAFQQVLTARQDDASALYALGRAQMGLTKFQDARAAFEKYVELRPQDAGGHYGLGLVLTALEHPDEARREFELSARLQPVQTEAYFELGKLDLSQSNLDLAAEQFKRVLERDPKHAGALLGMGQVDFQRKDYADASALLEQAIAAEPSLRQAHYYLGLTYARLGRTDDSKRELALASKLEHEELEKQRAFPRLVDPEELNSTPPK